jgi:methylmalonyl-CoA mutase cobalamin-binding subunit
MDRNLTVILAAPVSDAHVVALKLLELALHETGYNPVNLGVCRPTKDIAEAAASMADGGRVAVLLSCQNGHGLADLADLHDRLQVLGVTDAVHLFAGGRLVVGAEADRGAVRRAYRAIGITVLESFEGLFEALKCLAPASPAGGPRRLARAAA